MRGPMRDAVAALLRMRGYQHDDATDPDDDHWYGEHLGVRSMLVCLGHEMNRDAAAAGVTAVTGYRRVEVSIGVPAPEYALRA